jgi:hypothetical protein
MGEFIKKIREVSTAHSAGLERGWVRRVLTNRTKAPVLALPPRGQPRPRGARRR